jgi:hypothetical protein
MWPFGRGKTLLDHLPGCDEPHMHLQRDLVTADLFGNCIDAFET